ncbi:telomere maintenance protein Ccq1 [Schizosaccharomyces cryophilus OY26]|uniref:Telomere maintenance protein Ccq1 n=1 Tax=Schizosaccharomyces cryophilus (strain OY26 / ATCC MYA-4695 / CBS 11777 / NBRC 106824 / NRRL Y48691) TaxID=653667 RepID=S9VYH0_SCHCR|nr:telomere maintenance protein Ccq1 [Schizosaccharomyces cryophilus OY26]EPY51309.1 telomere maintenance protein Ccq1 [Schizosaccharomyces cryophilus OY26]
MSEYQELMDSTIVNESDSKFEIFIPSNGSKKWISKEECPGFLEDAWLLKAASHKRKLDHSLDATLDAEQPPLKQHEVNFLHQGFDPAENDFLTQDVGEYPSTQQLFPINESSNSDSLSLPFPGFSKTNSSVFDVGLPMSSIQRRMMHRLVQYFAFCIDHFCTGPSDTRIQEKIRLFLQSAHKIAKHPWLYEKEVRGDSDMLSAKPDEGKPISVPNMSDHAEASSKFIFIGKLLESISSKLWIPLFCFVSNDVLATLLTTWLSSTSLSVKSWSPETQMQDNKDVSLWVCSSRHAPSTATLFKSDVRFGAVIFYDMDAYMGVTSTLSSFPCPILRLLHINSVEHVIRSFQSSYNASFLVNIVGVLAALNSSTEENAQVADLNVFSNRAESSGAIVDASANHSHLFDVANEAADKVAEWIVNDSAPNSWPLQPLVDLANLAVAEPKPSQGSPSRIDDTILKSSDDNLFTPQISQTPSKGSQEVASSISKPTIQTSQSQQDPDASDFGNNYDLQGAAVQYLQRRLRMVEDELHEAVNVKNIKQSHADELEQQIAKLTDNLQEYREQVRGLKIELEKSQKNLEAGKKNDTERLKEVADLKQQITNLSKQLNFGFKFIQDMQEDELRARLLESNEQKYKLGQLNKTQKEDLDFITQQYQNASVSASEQTKEVARLQAENERLKMINGKAMEEVKSYSDARADALLAKVSSLEESLAILKKKTLPPL